MKLKFYMRKLQLYNEDQQPIYYSGVNPNSLNIVLGLIPDNDWQEVTRFIDNVDEFSATWKARTNGGDKNISNVEKSVSNELVLFDEAYIFVTEWLNNHVSAPLNAIEVRIEIENCGTIEDFIIKNDGMTYCDNQYCNIEVNLKQKDDVYTCIYSTLIADNHSDMFDGNYQHPRFSYCNEFRPTFFLSIIFQSLISIGGIIYFLSAIATVIMSIVWIITEIIDAISSLWGGSQIDTHISTPADFSHVLERWIVDLFGCGREHPAPLVRDYISNVCSKCGITVTQTSAPIFFNTASKYYNLCMLSAESKKGIDRENNNNFWIKDNEPLKTLDMFLDDLKGVFNAKWFVKNNILYFDRHDKFETDVFLYDFIGADKHLVLDNICFTWNEIKKGAFCRIGYSPDAMDSLTMECAPRYNDLVDYNTPVINPLLEGEENKMLVNFAPTRFRNDGINKDYVKEVLFPADDFGTAIGVIFTGIQIHAQIDWVKGKMHDYDYAILMQNHTTLLSRLIIWDGVSKRGARAIKQSVNTPLPNPLYNTDGSNYEAVNGFDNSSDSYIDTTSMLVNYPMVFDAMFKGNLWDFHQIDDPRFNPPINKTFEVSIPLCCEHLNKLGVLNNSGNIKIDHKVKVNGGTYYQEGVIEEVTIDFDGKSKEGKHIKIKGKI